MQLIKIEKIKGQIVLKSGMHIGAGDTEMHIGGTDSPVVRHPHTQDPYIPGSSLKGKVRSLLELKSGVVGFTGGAPLAASHFEKVSDDKKEEAKKILKIFGTGGGDADIAAKLGIGPTRVAFADCPLNSDWKNEVIKNRWSLFEVKSENAIDRIKGTAKDPRFIERVVAGAKFDFTVTLKILGKEEEALVDYLLLGLKLLQMDAIGGSGSRGYGRIEFQFEDKTIQAKFDELKATD